MSEPFAPGTTFGDYRIDSPLGEGGMGLVFLARDRTLDRPVALKFLADSLQQQPDARRRFLREAKAAAALDHPYICKIYQTGEVAGRPFIAMEYVRGRTLKDRLAAEPMPLKEVVRITLEVAEALETAHTARIVHLDLKPSNIMLTTGGHVKVLDFGLAKRVEVADTQAETRSELTQGGTVQGTLAYMSPQQVRAQAVDSRSDIFSLGVVLYEALTGRNPFHAASPLETASEILHRTPAPLRAVRADVPPLLEHIVAKMLAKAPDDRYQLLHELRTDLARVREAADQVDPAAPTVVVDDAAVPWVRRPSPTSVPVTSSLGRRHALRMGVAAAVLTVAALAGVWWNSAPLDPVGAPLSVAVAPLANLTGDPDNAYLANGIAQAVTTRLHKAEFTVIPFETVVRFLVRFPDTGDPTELARVLNVHAVLTGTLQIDDDDRLLVTVSLVEGESGFTFWTDEFEETFDDLFDVQTRLAQGVAERLGQELSGEAEATLATAESSSVHAYDLYLQGAGRVLAGDQESTEIGYQLFSRAVEIDPNLAEAHVGLGTVYSQRFWNGWGGGVSNLARAEASFQEALRLDPVNMRARKGLMHLQFYRGHSEAGLRLALEATRVGSDDIETLRAAAVGYTIHGLYDVAAPLLRQVLVLDPGNQTAAWFDIIRTFNTEQFEETAAAADTYYTRFGQDARVDTLGAHAHERLGNIDGARERFDRLTEPLLGSAGPAVATRVQLTALAASGVFYNRHGQPDRAQEVWRTGLELTRAGIELDPDSIGLRLYLAGFHGFLGDRPAFHREEARARAALTAAPDVNPVEFFHLLGAHAHLGDTEQALEILWRQLRDGRLPNLGLVGMFAPSVVEDPSFGDFRRAYDAEEQRFRERYAPVN